MNGKQCLLGLIGRVSRRSVDVLRAGIFSACIGLATAEGQPFENLDFESIGAPAIERDGIWLAWSLAAPGWTHAAGGDSVFVYHNTPPDSHLGLYYFLADSVSSRWHPLDGEFSLTLVSGHYNRNDAGSPWVNAAVEQTGTVPSDAKSLRMLALGEFQLSLNSIQVPIMPVGENLFVADVSSFAGEPVNLRIENTSRELHTPLLIDNLAFSVQAVPEPSVFAVFSIGMVFLLLRRRC